MVGFGLEGRKCFIFQWGLTDSLSAAALFSSVSDRSNRQQSSATKAVAASSAMLPLVTAQTVAFERGVGGRISRCRTLGGQNSSRSKSKAKFMTIPAAKSEMLKS